MHSHFLPGLEAPIELGAEFIHGKPQDLLALIQQAGLHVEEVDGTDYCFAEGKLAVAEEHQGSDVMEELKAFCVQHRDSDMSFADYLEHSSFDDDTRQQALGFVEGFNAADAAAISIQALASQQVAEDAIEGSRAFRIVEGYSALADYLFGRFVAAGGEMSLATTVHDLAWQKGQVRASGTSDGVSHDLPAARFAVIALPLGVLQANGVDIQPRPYLCNHFDKLSMGSARRLTLVFTHRFWDTSIRPYGDLSFLFCEQETPHVFWTRSPSSQPSLTAWAGGPSATTGSIEEFAEHAITTLARVFDSTLEELESQLVSAHSHPWSEDDRFNGAYSYVRAGGLAASKLLSVPVEDTLFFAGEHTDVTGHWGTVHGALRSGVRAAAQVLEARLKRGPAERGTSL